MQPPEKPRPEFVEPGSMADPGVPAEEWSGVPSVPTADTYRPKGAPLNLKPVYWGIGAVAVAFIVVPLLIYLLASGSQASQMSQLQGQWAAEASPGPAVIIIKDDRLISVRGTEEELGAFAIDVTADPMHFDLTLSSGPNQGQTLLGIYAVNGDRLTINLAGPGLPRPMRLDRPAEMHRRLVRATK